MRGAIDSDVPYIIQGNISIHTPHAGSDLLAAFQLVVGLPISIHTPHAGSDGDFTAYDKCKRISIHTPHAGSDDFSGVYFTQVFKFQSTLPMRGVTLARFLPPGCM